MPQPLTVSRNSSSDLAIQARMLIEREFFPKGLTTEEIRLVDRIEQFIVQAFQHGYQAADTLQSEKWSNNACLGYAILGARGLEYSEEQISKLVREINYEFDMKTISEARVEYESSPY